MMNASWIYWLLFMGIFLLFPLGFGWGYQGWGPPYPRYVQRRRAERAPAVDGGGTFNHHAWGYGGDMIWMGMAVATLWALSFMWWR